MSLLWIFSIHFHSQLIYSFQITFRLVENELEDVNLEHNGDNIVENDENNIGNDDNLCENEEAEDELLHPHGRQWVEIDGVNEQLVPDAYPDYSHINWRGLEGPAGSMHTPAQYFYHMFPMLELESMLQGTNAVLAEKGYRVTTKAEVLRWLGIRAVAAVEKRRGSVSDWFKKGSAEGTVLSFGNFAERFEMSESRFKVLTSCLRLRVAPQTEEEKGDKWYMIRKFVDSFNTLRKRNVTLGQYITADECMSAWVATSGEYRIDGIPNLTKIARKPQGVGCELKSIADPFSGIIMHLEIQEGKYAMRAKEKSAELGAGAACTWRMTKHWHGSGRTVIGDSWFGSFKCAKALKQVGLYSIFQIKTAHREYPMNFLKNWATEQENIVDDEGIRQPWGTWKALQHVDVEQNNNIGTTYYALCHFDRKSKFLLSNKGTTLPGTPLRVERCHIADDDDGRPATQWYIKETPRPNMMQLYFDHFNCIDVHDHRRQGVFQIEKYWLTKTWWHRIFATVGIGMCMVDAYLAYRMEFMNVQPDNAVDDMDDFMTFAGKVIYALIFNIYFDRPADGRRRLGEEDEEVLHRVSYSGII